MDIPEAPLTHRWLESTHISPPYLQSEYTMLVPAGSSIRSVVDADKSGDSASRPFAITRRP
jgi:hypothetical protein